MPSYEALHCILWSFCREWELSQKCAVQPLPIRVDAVLNNAASMAASLAFRALSRIRLVLKILPVPAGASTKITWALPFLNNFKPHCRDFFVAC